MAASRAALYGLRHSSCGCTPQDNKLACISVREDKIKGDTRTYLKGRQLQTVKFATCHPSVGDEEIGEAEIGELLVSRGGIRPKINIFGLGIRVGQVVPSRDKPVSVEVGLPQDEGAVSTGADRDTRGGHRCVGVRVGCWEVSTDQWPALYPVSMTHSNPHGLRGSVSISQQNPLRLRWMSKTTQWTTHSLILCPISFPIFID